MSIATDNQAYIIQEIRNGKYLKTLAQEFGVAPASLCRPLRLIPDYLHARQLSDQDRVVRELAANQTRVSKAAKLAVVTYLRTWGNDNWLVEMGLAAPDLVAWAKRRSVSKPVDK